MLPNQMRHRTARIIYLERMNQMLRTIPDRELLTHESQIMASMYGPRCLRNAIDIQMVCSICGIEYSDFKKKNQEGFSGRVDIAGLMYFEEGGISTVFHPVYGFFMVEADGSTIGL